MRSSPRPSGKRAPVEAERAGVSRTWLSDVERGESSTEIGHVLRTLDALGVVLRTVGRGLDHEILPPSDIDAIVRDARKQALLEVVWKRGASGCGALPEGLHSSTMLLGSSRFVSAASG